MDIEACLTELRNLSARENLDADDAHRLAELFNALDEYIRRSGYLPLAWQRSHNPLTAHLEG